MPHVVRHKLIFTGLTHAEQVFAAFAKREQPDGLHVVIATTRSDGYDNGGVQYLRVSKSEFDHLRELRDTDPLFQRNDSGLMVPDITVDSKMYLDANLPTLALAMLATYVPKYGPMTADEEMHRDFMVGNLIEPTIPVYFIVIQIGSILADDLD
jgi:hypothetical protein